jgi:PIN domain nuclease of toxin-antitoxin system
MILLDTHVLIWLDQGSPRLGAKTLKRINTAFKAGRLAASAIIFWEAAMLVNKQRANHGIINPPSITTTVPVI